MKNITILLLLLTINKCLWAQSVGIGTNTPDSSAALEINSNNKGLLLPRVSDTSSIKKPAKGLLVYNNYDNTPWYYDGNRWQKTIPDVTMTTEAIGMDSLWYKVQDTIAYTLYPYVQINTSLGLVPPQAHLQLTGNLLVQSKFTSSNTVPTAAQTYTMNNTATTQTIPYTDSVFRIYDPGGTGNYNNNMQGNVLISPPLKPAGLKISSVAADFGLGTGDTLWIAYDDFPACRTKYMYLFTNTTVNPADFVVGGEYIYFIFRSNADGVVNKGFNFSVSRLYSLENPKKIHTAGSALYFNSSNGAFGAGSNANANGKNSVALGGNTIANTAYSIAMGYAAMATGSSSMALGSFATASGTNSIAIGNYTTASGSGSVALGSNTSATSYYSTAMGSNTTASGGYSTATGKFTTAAGYASTAIGDSSTASGVISFASGFRAMASGDNSIAIGYTATASENYSTAIGSYVTASGFNATALGSSATASGSYSTAMGNFVNTNRQNRSFLIGDLSTVVIMNGTTPNNFRARFAGGYRFYTSADYSTSCVLSPGANAWSTISDVRLKENFASINGEEFLKKIAAMSLVSWNYKKQDPAKYRHYGPMAQDFYAAFGKDKYGNIGNDTTINSADFDGVNMIAIQALEKRTTLQQKQIEQLNTIILQLRKELDELKKDKP